MRLWRQITESRAGLLLMCAALIAFAVVLVSAATASRPPQPRDEVAAVG